MVLHWLAGITTVCVLLSLLDTSVAVCQFEYITQPPTSTNGCSPYQIGTNVLVILLECVASRQSGVTDKYEIRWFRENTNGTVEDLGRGDPDVLVPSGWLSQYHNMKLIHQQYNHSFVGKYWCQVINTTADPDQPLMRSNVFTLLPPDSYTASTCSEAAKIQRVDNVTCADQTEQFNQMTTPLPYITILSTAKQPQDMTTKLSLAPTAMIQQSTSPINDISTSQSANKTISISIPQVISMTAQIISNSTLQPIFISTPQVISAATAQIISNLTLQPISNSIPQVISTTTAQIISNSLRPISALSQQVSTSMPQRNPAPTSPTFFTSVPQQRDSSTQQIFTSSLAPQQHGSSTQQIFTSSLAPQQHGSSTQQIFTSSLAPQQGGSTQQIFTSSLAPQQHGSSTHIQQIFTSSLAPQQGGVHVLNTQALAASPSTTTSPAQQTSPWLYVAVSVGAVFIAVVTIMAVMLVVVLKKKTRKEASMKVYTDGTELINSTYSMGYMSSSLQFKQIIDSATYSEPDPPNQHAVYYSSPANDDDDSEHLYSEIKQSPTTFSNPLYSVCGGDSELNEKSTTAVALPSNDRNLSQSDDTNDTQQHAAYNKLDHTTLDPSSQSKFYSSLPQESATTPLYSHLQTKDNLCLTGNYETDPDYSLPVGNIPPTARTTKVSQEYTALTTATLDTPSKYETIELKQ